MARTPKPPNWTALLRSWDVQQKSFMPNRERRFTAMLDALGAAVPKPFTALDLGSGPGSLSVRLLRRFPSAHVVAVDYDPVTMRIGRGALGNFRGRLTWVDAKLGSPGWTERLPHRRIDAALSTTALHWLPKADLLTLYQDLGHRIRRGGVFLNGDVMVWGPSSPGFSRLAEKVRRNRYRGRSLTQEFGAWEVWWKRTEKIAALRPYFEERQRRAAGHPKHEPLLPLEVHERMLRQAGFREVGVIWQHFENRVLFARR